MDKIVLQGATTLSIVSLAPEYVEKEIAKGSTEQEVLQSYAIYISNKLGEIFLGFTPSEELPNNNGSASEYQLTDGVVSQSLYKDQIRCYRMSWIWDGTKVIEDPSEVSEIKKGRARDIRNQLLALSDVDELRFLASGGQQLIAIRTYRDALRNLGETIDTNPDAIIWPTK